MSAAPRALIAIDLQQGFADPRWGAPNNPACEENVARLVAAGDPLVVVQHASTEPDSPLRPGQPGHDLLGCVADAPAALRITKRVHSAFHGDVDLHAWLQEQGIGALVICGIQTNRCCETTARAAGDLGYDVSFALDATRTFAETGPDGTEHGADALARVTAVNLHGHFARVVPTAALL